jgi:hypothetical protein
MTTNYRMKKNKTLSAAALLQYNGDAAASLITTIMEILAVRKTAYYSWKGERTRRRGDFQMRAFTMSTASVALRVAVITRGGRAPSRIVITYVNQSRARWSRTARMMAHARYEHL